MPKHDLDPEGERLPIRIDGTSNGEFFPLSLSPPQLLANKLAHEAADALYHLLVLLHVRGLSLAEVCDVLEARHQP